MRAMSILVGSMRKCGSCACRASHSVRYSRLSGLPGWPGTSSLALATTTRGCTSVRPALRPVARTRRASSSPTSRSCTRMASTSSRSTRRLAVKCDALYCARVVADSAAGLRASLIRPYTNPLCPPRLRTASRDGSALLPGPDTDPEPLLGGAGLRADPAARHRGRRGHLPSRDVPARARPRALARGLRAAFATADRRALRREPEPPAALLPVPGRAEAESRRHPRALLRLAEGARHRSAGARPAPGRGQLGVADARGLGTRLGSLAQRHGGDAVHLLPGRRRARLPSRDRRDHLWARAARDVPAEPGQRVRPRVDQGSAGHGALRRRVPPERGRAVALQLRARRRGGARALVRGVRGRGAEARRARPRAARLRAGVQGLARVQPARRAPRDRRDRAPALHPARARPGQGRGGNLLRGERAPGLSRAQGAGGMSATVDERAALLIELGTEELPPKALPELAQAFRDGVVAGLSKRGIACEAAGARALWSPRRLAVLIGSVGTSQPDQALERRGPAVGAGFDAQGNPSKALLGFAQSCGVEVSALEKLETDKGAWFVHRAQRKGEATAALLPEIAAEALKALPIPKPMRWGAHEHAFVRPVHWLVLLLGEHVVAGELFGCRSERTSRGHRFHHPERVWIASPEHYVDTLRQSYVMVDPVERRAVIKSALEDQARREGGEPHAPDALLDEVANLVEWPVAVTCAFDAEYLRVPPEALITTMEANQRFFPMLSADGSLTEIFIGIANVESRDPDQIRK